MTDQQHRTEGVSDDRIIAVALRRMAVLSDESAAIRARAEVLAEVFDTADAQNEEEGR